MRIIFIVCVALLAACTSSTEEGFQLASQGNYIAAIEKLREPALNGSSKAQAMLGMIYMEGKGLEVDIDEAIKWFEMSAKQGTKGSQYNLGYWLAQEGRYGEAIKWYGEAAEQGHLNAMYNMAMIYKGGSLGESDYVQARRWLEKVAESGHREASFYLGNLYERGLGGAVNTEKAVELYLSSAGNGFPLAQNQIGLVYLHGRGVAKDEEKGIHWLEKAAENNNSDAQLRLARKYILVDSDKGRLSEGVELLEKAVTNNNAGAKYLYGYLLSGLWDEQLVKLDVHRAYKLFGEAAESGDAGAQRILGEGYLTGDAGSIHMGKAKKWLTMAAGNNDSLAQLKLGGLYFDGHPGFSRDYSAAANWFSKAVEQGSVHALFYMGLANKEGKGVLKDFVEAHAYFDLASLYEKDPESQQYYQEYRDALAKQLNKEELSRATTSARSVQNYYSEAGVTPW